MLVYCRVYLLFIRFSSRRCTIGGVDYPYCADDVKGASVTSPPRLSSLNFSPGSMSSTLSIMSVSALRGKPRFSPWENPGISLDADALIILHTCIATSQVLTSSRSLCVVIGGANQGTPPFLPTCPKSNFPQTAPVGGSPASSTRSFFSPLSFPPNSPLSPSAK